MPACLSLSHHATRARTPHHIILQLAKIHTNDTIRFTPDTLFTHDQIHTPRKRGHTQTQIITTHWKRVRELMARRQSAPRSCGALLSHKRQMTKIKIRKAVPSPRGFYRATPNRAGHPQRAPDDASPASLLPHSRLATPPESPCSPSIAGSKAATRIPLHILRGPRDRPPQPSARALTVRV